MSDRVVTVFGGSGFIGRYVVQRLARTGVRVNVAVRHVERAKFLKTMGNVGQITPVACDITDAASVARAVQGADAVVNLVGILFEHGRQTFAGEQADGAALLAQVAAEKGIDRFVQVSAIGADAGSKSPYGRTKAAAEEAVREAIPSAVILRPSIVFGPEDQFFNRFANLARFAPFLPSIGGGKTRFQPVYAGDVAEAIAAAVTLPDAAGKTFELGGPRTYSFNDIYDIIMRTTDRKRFKIPVPFFVIRPFAYITGAVWRFVPPFSWGFFGAPPITGSQIEMLTRDNIVAPSAMTIGDLGVDMLESVEAIVPSYLWRFRPYGEFHKTSEA